MMTANKTIESVVSSIDKIATREAMDAIAVEIKDLHTRIGDTRESYGHERADGLAHVPGLSGPEHEDLQQMEMRRSWLSTVMRAAREARTSYAVPAGLLLIDAVESHTRLLAIALDPKASTDVRVGAVRAVRTIQLAAQDAHAAHLAGTPIEGLAATARRAAASVAPA